MKVLLVVEVRFGGVTMPCRILDLSRGGACVEGERRPAVGDSVALARGMLNARGTVTWIKGTRFGACFTEPLRATELLVQMSQSREAEASATAFRFGGDASAPSPSR